MILANALMIGCLGLFMALGAFIFAKSKEEVFIGCALILVSVMVIAGGIAHYCGMFTVD